MSSTEQKSMDGTSLFVDMTTDIEKSPWYNKDISSLIRPETHELLTKYAGVAPEDIVAHIEQARNKAWTLSPYPSVGAMTWLNSYLLLHPAHTQILSRLKEGASILDCGCMISPDLRQLACERAPTEDMYAFDIEPGFFDIGYDFYRDRQTFKGTFFAADGYKNLEETELAKYKGFFDIIWAPKFLHLWDRATQITMAAKFVKLLQPQPGSMFVVSQNGYPDTLEVPIAPRPGGNSTFWAGNVETTKEDWSKVAELTGTKWNLEVRLFDLRTNGMHKDDGSEYKKRTGYNLQWTATML